MRYSNGSFDETLLESGLISQFLADAHPSHLLPANDSSPTAPLFRYRVNFFVDTYFTKVNTYLYAIIRAANDEEKKTKADEWVKAIEKEIEPLLHDANPFFGGSKEMTLAEVFFPPYRVSRAPICMFASTELTPRPPSRSRQHPSSSASTTLQTISSFPLLSPKP
jgi:glutathione S-transferase